MAPRDVYGCTGVLNFEDEPELKSKISACGPLVHIGRTAAFLGIMRGYMWRKGNRHKPGSTHGPRASQGTLGIPSSHSCHWFRFDAFFSGVPAPSN